MSTQKEKEVNLAIDQLIHLINDLCSKADLPPSVELEMIANTIHEYMSFMTQRRVVTKYNFSFVEKESKVLLEIGYPGGPRDKRVLFEIV